MASFLGESSVPDSRAPSVTVGVPKEPVAAVLGEHATAEFADDDGFVEAKAPGRTPQSPGSDAKDEANRTSGGQMMARTTSTAIAAPGIGGGGGGALSS